jgi:hypothetical protein
MLSTLVYFIVVLCELYIIVWVLGFFLGLVNAAWRAPFYPVGPSALGSVGSLIVAIAVVVVFGHHNLGF